MQENIVKEYEQTPTFSSKKCKAISFIVAFILQYTTILATIITWYRYDYFIALLVATLSFVIVGIVRSKIRNSSIPIKQREFTYSDKETANWYTAKEFCTNIENHFI